LEGIGRGESRGSVVEDAPSPRIASQLFHPLGNRFEKLAGIRRVITSRRTMKAKVDDLVESAWFAGGWNVCRVGRDASDFEFL
jgi:hypothetical protein